MVILNFVVFQGTFRDAWAAAKVADSMAVKEKPRYRMLRVVKDWEAGTATTATT